MMGCVRPMYLWEVYRYLTGMHQDPGLRHCRTRLILWLPRRMYSQLNHVEWIVRSFSRHQRLTPEQDREMSRLWSEAEEILNPPY